MKKILLFLFFVLSSVPYMAFAVGSGGFENASFSGKSLAQSNAVVAQADEPAAISYNPAGITQLPGIQVQANTAFISLFTHHSRGGESSHWSSGTISPIPTAYATVNPGRLLGDRVAFGIGSDSPFGLSNKYDANQPHVRYTGWRNYLKMYTIKPVAAIKVTDWLSIGGGPMYYRVFDFGGIQAYPNVLVAGGLTTDGQVRVNVSGNHWGWQFGALAKPHDQHQLGFYFRSPVTVLTKGIGKVENSTTGNFETGVHAKLDLPLNFTWAYAFLPNPKTKIEVDLGYTRWGSYDRLFFDTHPVNGREDAILAAIGKADKDYQDSIGLHLGGHYDLTQKIRLHGGSLFYWAAVPNDSFIPAIADSNSLAFSLGTTYKLTKNIDVDLAYFTRFWLRRQIGNALSEALGTSVDGRYFSYLQEFFVSFTYKWDNLFGKIGNLEKNESVPALADIKNT